MHLLLNDYNIIQYDDNSSFSDYSDEMRRWTADTMGAVLTKAEDYIYIGAPHSFSSRFIHIDTVNDVSASLDVEYYAGSTIGWRSVKNVTDETRSGAVCLAKSGFLSWDLPKDWIKNQVNSLPELEYNSGTGDGYGYFWVRIKASQTLNVNTTIKWLGLIWTNHEMMQRRWAEVLDSRYLPTGQTDWYELIEMSTRDVGNDLNIQNIIDYELQAKDVGELGNLTSLKTLINILTPMTSSETLVNMKKEFEKLYDQAMRVRIKSIDANKNEKIDNVEEKPIYNTQLRRR